MRSRRSFLRQSSVLLVTAAAVGAAACGARSPIDDFSRVARGGSSTQASSTATIASSVVSSTTTNMTDVGPIGSSVSTGPGGQGGGVIISESGSTFIEAETSVVAGSNGLVYVAWIGVPQSNNTFIGYAVSQDDGLTWGPPQEIDAPGGRVSSDPVLAVDGQNNVYLSWVGYRFQGMSPVDMHVYVARAANGATSFGAPVDASGSVSMMALVDKPWVTVTNKGTVVVTYSQADQTYSIKLARSADQGNTWTQSVIATDPTLQVFRNLAYPCAPPNGDRIFATYLAFGNTSVEAHLAHSDDDGLSWVGGDSDTRVSLPNEPVAFDDPTCVTNGKEVWVTYGLTMDPPSDMDAAKSFAVKLAHSADLGTTIDTYQDVGDTQAAALFLHAQVVQEDNGALDFVYWAGQFDQDDQGAFRRSRSPVPAGGVQSSVIVQTPITFLGARGDARWLGDYPGVYTRKGELFMSYVDNSQGVAHIAFAKANVP